MLLVILIALLVRLTYFSNNGPLNKWCLHPLIHVSHTGVIEQLGRHARDLPGYVIYIGAMGKQVCLRNACLGAPIENGVSLVIFQEKLMKAMTPYRAIF